MMTDHIFLEDATVRQAATTTVPDNSNAQPTAGTLTGVTIMGAWGMDHLDKMKKLVHGWLTVMDMAREVHDADI